MGNGLDSVMGWADEALEDVRLVSNGVGCKDRSGENEVDVYWSCGLDSRTRPDFTSGTMAGDDMKEEWSGPVDWVRTMVWIQE